MLAATSDSLTVGDLRANFFAVACAGIALRAIVSLHSYSGSGTPPMYGDYEAQRHWQELTVNIPVIEWYKNSSNNNLQYWGLDYPPLTAYHSYFMGKLAYTLNSTYVVLKKSHGIETASHKTFMRLTVLAADIILFIPSAILFAVSVGKIFDHYQEYILPALVIILIYPGQILVDNGHFQYNNISLGLTTLAVVCICREWHFFSSLLFTLAINYKQMELYHSIPFFIYILGQCLRKKRFYSHLVLHAITVVMTCIILWFPWILTLNSFKEVAGRIFPLARGVYEDKVANFWCAVNIVIKLKHVSNQQLAKICAFSTFLSVTPTVTNLYQKATKWNFVYSLFNCALGFYLFSFQIQDDEADIHGFSQPTLSVICRIVAVAFAKNRPHPLKIRKVGGTSGQYYINRKGYYSLNTQVVCDASLKIRDTVCHTHDSRIFRESRIKQRFENDEFLGRLLRDGGYACSNILFTPISNPQTNSEINYKKAHIQTRNTVERCFGVWKQRFRVLLTGMRCSLSLAKTTIVALAVLHNLASEFADEHDNNEDYDDVQPPNELFRQNTYQQQNLIRTLFIEQHFQ